MWCGKTGLTAILLVGFAGVMTAQPRVLVPDRSTAVYAYSLTEWIAQASGWGWVSRDRIQGELHPDAVGLGIDRGPIVFVRGIPLHTGWNGNALFRMPDWPISDIDSVVVHEPGSVVYGFVAVDGAIDIHPKTFRRITGTVSSANPTRDPGTLMASPYDSPNVERVGSADHLLVPLRFKRYVSLTRMDDISRNYLSTLDPFGRPFFAMLERTTDPAQPDLWPWHGRHSLSHVGQWTGPERRTDVFWDAYRTREYYLWDEVVGSELIFRDHGGRFGVRNASNHGRGWRFAAAGSLNRHDMYRYEPTYADGNEIRTYLTAGFASTRWEADAMADARQVGAGLMWRHPSGWTAQTLLTNRTRLFNASVPYRGFRASASVIADRYGRIGLDAPGGFRLTHTRYRRVPETDGITRASWSGGKTIHRHRFDGLVTSTLGPHPDPRFSRFIARAAWRWQANGTFGMAVSASYRSARRFDGALFPDVPAHTDIGLNLYQTLFRNRLRLDLNLRNMLDRMDTDHPDGVIHPMSVEYRIRLAL